MRFLSALLICCFSSLVLADEGLSMGWAEWTFPTGQTIIYPSDWIVYQGKNQVPIATPPGWSAHEGPDGQAVAVPPGFVWAVNRQGRVVVSVVQTVATDKCEILIQKIPRNPRTSGHLVQQLKALGPGPCSD